jgi:hypothetical protein
LAKAHSASYDLLIATVLDPAIPLGGHRDRDLGYRAAVDRHIHRILTEADIAHQSVASSDSGYESKLLASLGTGSKEVAR